MNIFPLKRYSKYALNNVRWAGETPAHWAPTRNKDIFSERGALSLKGDETLLTVSHITGVTRRSEKNVNMFMAETMEGYKHVKQGDMVINTMWAWMGALGCANGDGICSPAYGVYAPRKNIPYCPRYFDYLYRTPAAIIEMTRNSKGIVSSRLRLYPKDFFQIETALPPYDEQVEISDYLDARTLQINGEIELLEKKVINYELLKKSLIHHTVRHGLNNLATERESSIEWIGKIPEHWGLVRGKNIFREHEKSKITAAEGMPKGKYKFFNSSNKQSKWLDFFMRSDEGLIFSTGGSAGVNYCEKEYSYSTDCWCISPYKPKLINLKFYGYFFTSILSEIQQLAFKGAGLEHLQKDFIRFNYLPFPPLDEQDKIAKYLDEKIEGLDKILMTIDAKIDVLKDFRKTLVNDVVTGKIKVTNKGDLA